MYSSNHQNHPDISMWVAWMVAAKVPPVLLSLSLSFFSSLSLYLSSVTYYENIHWTHWKPLIPPRILRSRIVLVLMLLLHPTTYVMRKVAYGIQYIPKSFESTYLLARFCSDDFNTIESKPISDGFNSIVWRFLCTCSIGMKLPESEKKAIECMPCRYMVRYISI